MTRKWKDRICDNVRCANCGGEVYIKQSAPIVKGGVSVTKCIRCSNEGGWKWKITWDENKYTDLVVVE